jgi:hypothetical protein
MLRRKNIFVVLALLVCLPGTAPAQQAKSDPPRFADYPVFRWFGKIAPLNQRSHPLARKYRTLIREQMKEAGVNFAGHFTLASVGCGAGCSITAIIDAHTGRAFFPNELLGWTGIVGDYDPPEGEEPWTYRPGSTLLRAIGRPNIGKAGEERHGASGIYYYEWNNNRFRLVKFTPVGSYPEADPPGVGAR